MSKAVFQFCTSGPVGRERKARAGNCFATGTQRRFCLTLRGFALVFALQLGIPARAQDAIAVAAKPTQDQILYGKHSPVACNPKLAKKEGAEPPNGTPCLNQRERRTRRRWYQEHHRDEFPAQYYPGVE